MGLSGKVVRGFGMGEVLRLIDWKIRVVYLLCVKNLNKLVDWNLGRNIKLNYYLLNPKIQQFTLNLKFNNSPLI